MNKQKKKCMKTKKIIKNKVFHFAPETKAELSFLRFLNPAYGRIDRTQFVCCNLSHLSHMPAWEPRAECLF